MVCSPVGSAAALARTVPDRAGGARRHHEFSVADLRSPSTSTPGAPVPTRCGRATDRRLWTPWPTPTPSPPSTAPSSPPGGSPEPPLPTPTSTRPPTFWRVAGGNGGCVRGWRLAYAGAVIESGPHLRVRQPGTDTQGASHLRVGMWSAAPATKCPGSGPMRHGCPNLRPTRRIERDERRERRPLGRRAGHLPSSALAAPPCHNGPRHRRLAARRPVRTAPVRGWPSTGRSCWRAAASSTTSPSRSRPGASCHPPPTTPPSVCHAAATGDAHAAGPAGEGHPTPGWWDDLIGPGKPIDTDRYYVVCANVLGGCQGSSGPASPSPDRLGCYGPEFPVVSMRDTRPHAGPGWLTRWASTGGRAVIGGPDGRAYGRRLEWASMYPERVARLSALATRRGAATAQQIVAGSTGRRAIALDPAGGRLDGQRRRGGRRPASPAWRWPARSAR